MVATRSGFRRGGGGAGEGTAPPKEAAAERATATERATAAEAEETAKSAVYALYNDLTTYYM